MPRFRADVVGALPWVVAGCLWVAQLFVAWTSAGLLSSSSMLDTVRLIRDGVVGATVPGWVAPAVLVLPALGVLLVAASVWAGRTARVLRGGLGALGSLTVVAVAFAVVGGELGRLGTGAWCAVIGMASAAAGVLVDRRTC